MTNPISMLGGRLAPAFAAVAGEAAADPAVRRSERADYQADGALALARRLGRNPRELAAEVVGRVRLDDLCERVEIAGPGFVNLTLREPVVAGLLADMAGERLGVPVTRPAATVVVDYSAPNVAKEMHVGHLRSTIIGDALCRIQTFLGNTVIRQNHLGDWGTPFGMLIEHLLDIGEQEAVAELSVGDLSRFYQDARRKFDGDEAFAERSRRRVVALQSGDEPTLALWRLLYDQSRAYFQHVYRRLGVLLIPEDEDGESRYNPVLASIVDELKQLGLLEVSDGALCVFPPGFTNRQGQRQPLIVRKADGGYGYAATDLATIRLRARDLGATRILYVVGAPQQLHLEMVFATARMAGWLGPEQEAVHVGFGSVLGPDRKLLRTRAGASIRLADLLDEAAARAAALLREKRPELDEAAVAELAAPIGIGAVKYADLSNDRIRDYVFSWDRMLALDGNTAPYLQYANTRIRSIFRRGGVPDDVTAPVCLPEPAERALALHLLGFEEALGLAAERHQPHRLCTYLYELATSFSAFYEACPVLQAEDEGLRASRLALCALSSRVLTTGLGLLGIQAPDQM